MPDAAPALAFLSLGSNIAPETNIAAAVRELAAYGRVVRASRVWETPPVGFPDQPNYLNAAVLLETTLSAPELHDVAIAAIEHKLGRVRDPGNRNAPRTIDIDIALFNREVLSVGHRTIPDPDILSRAFVAVPLAELDMHPEDGRTLAEIAAALKATTPEMRLRPDVPL